MRVRPFAKQWVTRMIPSRMSNASPASENRSLPITVGLLSRRSLTGGVVVLAVALFFVLGVPAVNNAVEGENPFEVGEPYVVAGSYQITPAQGWKLDSESELFTTIRKSGSSLILTGAVDVEGQTPEESIQLTVTAFENDQTDTWVIGEPQTFVTNAGDHGVKLVAHGSESGASESWVVSNGSRSITVIASSPESVWSSVSEDLDLMVSSIVFSSEESTG